MAVEITSDSQIEINQHFRVSAGPGAGKTHWLALHVAHVVRSSDRLGKIGKVACLSYTNVGADTLMGRLRNNGSRILSCTIHSFLYAYIVKPFLRFIAKEEGFDINLLKGEDDRILSDYKTIETVISGVKQPYAEQEMVVSAIRSAKWKLQDDGSLKCVATPPKKCCEKGYALRDDAYGIYKKLAWQKGYMHYDDVLYFSYKLVKKYPFISRTLAVQFPYLFVDEFQDTNPIQASIIKTIGENGSIIGVIGDYAQSIYGFLGADPEQFETFSLNGLQDYIILDNRRSSNEIVALLNLIRKDFRQKPLRNKSAMRPILLVGELMTCYEEAKRIAGSEVLALSYRNVEANILKQRIDAHTPDSALINKIIDSNTDRREFVSTWIKAIEHARNKQFGAAFKMLETVGVMELDAYSSLKEALDNYGNYCDGTLMDFFEYLLSHWNITKIREKTKAYKFYTNYSYRQLSQSVGLMEDSSTQRTVHKAKGDEFENVLVIFTDDKSLNVLIKPNIKGWEADRVYYVAMSRARDRLFLTVPTLNSVLETTLSKLPIDIKYVTNC